MQCSLILLVIVFSLKYTYMYMVLKSKSDEPIPTEYYFFHIERIVVSPYFKKRERGLFIIKLHL